MSDPCGVSGLVPEESRLGREDEPLFDACGVQQVDTVCVDSYNRIAARDGVPFAHQIDLTIT